MAGTATLTFGAEKYEGAAIVGSTVAEARDQFAGPFEIPGGTRAQLNGNQVANEGGTYINAGDTLVFVNAVGEKGC